MNIHVVDADQPKITYNTLKAPLISWKLTVHDFIQCVLRYYDEMVCVVVACEARVPAVLWLQIGDKVRTEQTTLENKGYSIEKLYLLL